MHPIDEYSLQTDTFCIVVLHIICLHCNSGYVSCRAFAQLKIDMQLLARLPYLLAVARSDSAQLVHHYCTALHGSNCVMQSSGTLNSHFSLPNHTMTTCHCSRLSKIGQSTGRIPQHTKHHHTTPHHTTPHHTTPHHTGFCLLR